MEPLEIIEEMCGVLEQNAKYMDDLSENFRAVGNSLLAEDLNLRAKLMLNDISTIKRAVKEKRKIDLEKTKSETAGILSNLVNS